MDTVNVDLIRIVKEMNEADYEMNILLVQEYQSLIDSDITTKQAILLELIQKHTKLTVREIADHMKVSSSAISQIVSKLEKAKYVKREINLNNRREILVTLDEAGVQYFENQSLMEQLIIERFYSRLDIEEVLKLKEIVLKLNRIVVNELS
jgi:MarR family transcriptional regulator, organic hydroperoxide resistance regulator